MFYFNVAFYHNFSAFRIFRKINFYQNHISEPLKVPKSLLKLISRKISVTEKSLISTLCNTVSKSSYFVSSFLALLYFLYHHHHHFGLVENWSLMVFQKLHQLQAFFDKFYQQHKHASWTFALQTYILRNFLQPFYHYHFLHHY